MLASKCPPAALSISTVSRNAETGTFRFTFEVGEVEVSADLTVAWIEEKREAFLQWCEVDRVRRVDVLHSDLSEGGRAPMPGQDRGEAIQGVDDGWERVLKAWVREHEREVFLAALEAA